MTILTRYLPLRTRNALVRQHDTDAGYDLIADESLGIPARGWSDVLTGIKVKIPEGHVGLVCSRSGMAKNDGVFVLNAPGIIDPGFTGEIRVILANMGEDLYYVSAGQKIAQLVIVPLSPVTVAAVTPEVWAHYTHDADRGEAGFGSTGR